MRTISALAGISLLIWSVGIFLSPRSAPYAELLLLAELAGATCLLLRACNVKAGAVVSAVGMCCSVYVGWYFGPDFFSLSRPRSPGGYFMTMIAVFSIFVAPVIATIYTARDIVELQKARS